MGWARECDCLDGWSGKTTRAAYSQLVVRSPGEGSPRAKGKCVWSPEEEESLRQLEAGEQELWEGSLERSWGLVWIALSLFARESIESSNTGHGTMGLFSEKTSVMLCGVWLGTAPEDWWAARGQWYQRTDPVPSKPAQCPWKPPCLLLGMPAVSPPSRENHTCKDLARRCGEQEKSRYFHFLN